MTQEIVTRTRRGRTALTWAAANLALGYCAVFPLVSAVLFGSYVRAEAWGSLAGADHDPEPGIALGFFVTAGVPLAAAAVVANRALRRRLRLRGWPATAFWAATVAILLTPFALWTRNPDLTVPQMLGKGLLW